MDWKLMFVVIAVLVAVVNSVQNEASESGSASGSGSGSAAGEGSVETAGKKKRKKKTRTTVAATEAGTNAAGTGDADASVDINIKGTTTAFEIPDIPDGSVDNKEKGSSDPTTTKPPRTTTPRTTTPSPPSGCPGMCNQPDFNGFGYEPGKCGCCPWPCCCKCVNVTGSDHGQCSALLDLSIILDSSGSIGTTNWVIAKQFVYNILQNFNGIGDGQRVAMTTFSSNAKKQWGFDDQQTSSAENLGVAINNLELISELTNTVEALEVSINEIFVPPSDNPLAKNVALLFTDGKPNFRIPELETVSNQLRAKAETICVGVTDRVSRDQLRLTCDEDKIFSVNQFTELTNLIGSLQTMICPEPPVEERCFCCCTPEQYYGMPSRYRF